MTPMVWPHFDPVFLRIGPLAIHYYALAYISALLIGWWIVRKLVAWPPMAANGQQVDDFLTWATLGIILGGRLGYILFYQPIFFLTHPTRMIAIWDGGMSFHGGFLGVTLAIILFCYKNHIRLLRFSDRIAVVVPLGLFLGRIANFINGELWGRPAASWFPFPMVYPQSGSSIPRYPSELIEASLEGVALFLIMIIAVRSNKFRSRDGTLTGLFVFGYGIARIVGESFREPDAFLGFLPFGITMGQILSAPMVIGGAGTLIWVLNRQPNPVKESQ